MIELKLATKTNVARTINNLVKCCFKDYDLKNYSYEKLKAIDENLLTKIHSTFSSCSLLKEYDLSLFPYSSLDLVEYAAHVHAPLDIPQSKFSSTISSKCRHLRESKVYKKGGTKSSKQKSPKEQNNSNNNNQMNKENVPQASNVDVTEEMAQDEENDDSDDMF